MTSEEYEDYSATSKDYDRGRQVVGLEVILGALTVNTKRQLRELHIVDVGCGTGNYLVALSDYVGQVTGVEYNRGMLEQARAKTNTLQNVTVQEADATNLPLPELQMDGIVCNQVLHHIQLPGTEEFGGVKKFMQEAYHVLRPGGMLVVNTCTPEQLVATYWFKHIIPAAVARLTQKYPPLPLLRQQLEEVGFHVNNTFILTSESFMKEEMLLDVQGPFDPLWRNTNSTWSLATPEELEMGLKKWRQLVEEGKAEQYIAKCEEQRRRLGQSTSVVAVKPVGGAKTD